MSTVLTCVPEKRREVHSEHKLSTLSLSSRNEIFPRWPEPARLVSFSALWDQRRGVGKPGQMCPSPGPQAGLDPSTPGGGRAGQVLEVIPGVRDL